MSTIRDGSGRKAGTPNKASGAVRAMAAEYGRGAFLELAKLSGLLINGDGNPVAGAQSEATRLSAIGMVLDRAYGRPLTSRPIQVDLPDTSTVEGNTKAVAALIKAVATGEITPREASDLCSVLDIQRRAIELSEIEARLVSLERVQG